MHCQFLLSAIAATLVLTTPARAAATESEAMRPVTLHGYEIIDAEYLPFIADRPVNYPADALWGFYPSGATDAAKRCALQSYRTLLRFFSDDCSDLHTTIAVGATPRFALWINDYSRSSRRPNYRTPRLWHRGATARDFTQGTWTWETTLTPDLSCIQPTRQQILGALQAARDAIVAKQ